MTRRRIVLVVTGGIAAYRACDLVGRLREAGVDTRCAMTRAATGFVHPRTFAALTGHPVLLDEFEGPPDPVIQHIEFARYAEAVVVAPASADFLGRLANGLADDAPTAMMLALAPDRPVLLCPAMNTRMWENPFVRANLRRIAEVGGARFRVLEPVEKRLACGEHGAGGLPPTEEIVGACLELLARGPSGEPRADA